MERFHFKVTVVFLVTILIPSLLLCFFALQTVNVEQKQQKITRRARTRQSVDIFARDLFTTFDEPRRELVRLLDEARPQVRELDDVVAALRAFGERQPLLTRLFLYEASGRRSYPRPNPKSEPEAPPAVIVDLSSSAPRALGGSGGLTSAPVPAADVILRARELFRSGKDEAARRWLAPLIEDPDPRVHLTAALEAARFAFARGDLAGAKRLLSPRRDADIALRGVLGGPIGAELRIELAAITDRAGEAPLAEAMIDALYRDLRLEAPRLAPNTLEAIARKAELLLNQPHMAFEPLLQDRRSLEVDKRDLELIFGGDFQRLFRSYTREVPRPDDENLLRSDGSESRWRADYSKHRAREKYLIILYAPVFDRGGELLGLCGFRVDLESFREGVLEARIARRNRRDVEVRFVATNPLFDSAETEARGDEEDEPIAQRLSEPLDHIQVRGFQKSMTPAVRLANQQARLQLWLIVMSMIGISLGVIVTSWTVRREARASELKTDFVANVTHELKTPLTSIRLFIETLELDHVESEEERRECLAIMARETDRLTRLIDRLLAFSKLDKRRWKLRLTYEDPAQLIREAIALFKNQHGVTDVDIKVESLQSPRVAVDREAMIEVIYNLIHNAFKYTPQSHRDVRVSVAERRRDVIISVNDNGVGVPYRDRKRIFRKFERGAYAERAQIQGSGIGLTLARSIVRGHGGDLTYNPNKPNGSRFVISLPK